MTIEELVFQKVRPDFTKLEAAGFAKIKTYDNKTAYVYATEFLKGEFKAVLTICEDGRIYGSVIDAMTEEEYLPLRVSAQTGSFVSTVRHAYEELLKQIAMQIGIPAPFSMDQANRITRAIAETYGDVPDFPWSQNPSRIHLEEYGVFRIPANQKWYGLIMYVDETVLKTREEKEAEKKAAGEAKKLREKERQKREAMKKAGIKPPRKARAQAKETAPVRKLDIMNLKINSPDAETLYREPGVYPAYHMSQKSWISVPLDDTLSDERILELVGKSYELVMGKRQRPRGTGPKSWLVPANPKYYDIVGVFDQAEDTIWKQGKSIETGDTCYMYVALPYSAILYKVKVTKAYSGKEAGMDLMEVHIEERYDKKAFPLTKMKEFGVTTVRSPRYIPEELIRYIDEHK